MIDLTFTIQQARKVVRALAGNADADVTAVREELDRWLGVRDAQVKNMAPWRKVTAKRAEGVYRFEDLECGHSYMLRHSKNWDEEHAKRRRCEKCKAAR